MPTIIATYMVILTNDTLKGETHNSHWHALAKPMNQLIKHTIRKKSHMIT